MAKNGHNFVSYDVHKAKIEGPFYKAAFFHVFQTNGKSIFVAIIVVISSKWFTQCISITKSVVFLKTKLLFSSSKSFHVSR